MQERPILFSGPMVRAILEGRKTQTRRVVKSQPEEEWCPEVGMYAPPMVDRYGEECPGLDVFGASDEYQGRVFPYGCVGDRLWVREAWTSGYQDGAWGTICRADGSFIYGKRQHEKGPHFHAKEIGPHIRWRPSIFMPRWASRITLEITDVRVQRLQDISEEEAEAEGAFFTDYGRRCFHRNGPPQDLGDCPAPLETHPQREGWSMLATKSSDECLHDPQMAFASLWNTINAKRGFGWDKNPWVWALTFKPLSD